MITLLSYLVSMNHQVFVDDGFFSLYLLEMFIKLLSFIKNQLSALFIGVGDQKFKFAQILTDVHSHPLNAHYGNCL